MSSTCVCPSGRCRTGAVLIGVHTAEGLGYVSPPLPVDQQFIALVEQSGGGAEQRFRFSEPCVERGCQQWTDGACGLIGRLLEAHPEQASTAGELPACGIRSQCRWYQQAGSSACGVCPLVVTDSTASLVPIALDFESAAPPP